MYLLEHGQVSKTILAILVGRCVKSQDVPKTMLAILYACDIKYFVNVFAFIL